MIFENKIALVTGSSRGIGREIALCFAERGAHVVINYVHNESPAKEVAQKISGIGRQAITVRANIGKMDGLQRLFEETDKQFGRLDFFIANAASGFNRPGMEQKESGWDHTLSVNAKSFLFGAQLALPLIEKAGGGAMVAVTSPGAERVMPDYIAVGASKAALNSLVRYLAVELAPKHISVNAISPGIVETDALKHFSSLKDTDVISKAINATPAGRLVTPRDIAHLAAFLCSPDAEMIRGQVVTIDGGYTLPARN